jgi:hypothetical protein
MVLLWLTVTDTVRMGEEVVEGDAVAEGQGVEEWERETELEGEGVPEVDSEGLTVPHSRWGDWQGEGEVVGVVRWVGEEDLRVDTVGVEVSQALRVSVSVGVWVVFVCREAVGVEVRVVTPPGEGESWALMEVVGGGVVEEVVEGVVEGVPARVPESWAEGEGG